MRSIYQKYGMAVPVSLPFRGEPMAPVPLPATDNGFEARVRRYLSFLDVGLWRERLAAPEGRIGRLERRGAAAILGEDIP